ncbi:MAG: hypothetical protein ABI073_08960 [Luteolibacter sp.]
MNDKPTPESESLEVTLPVLLFIQRIYRIETQTRQTAAPSACRERGQSLDFNVSNS